MGYLVKLRPSNSWYQNTVLPPVMEVLPHRFS